jgi:hypothetical protein
MTNLDCASKEARCKLATLADQLYVSLASRVVTGEDAADAVLQMHREAKQRSRARWEAAFGPRICSPRGIE